MSDGMGDLVMRKLYKMTQDGSTSVLISFNETTKRYTVETGHIEYGEWKSENAASDLFLVEAVIDLERMLRGE